MYKRQERDYAYNLAMAMIQKKKMPSDEILAAAGLTQADAKKLGARVKSSGGGSRKGGGNSSGGAIEGLSYGELSGYLYNGAKREQMTGSREYSNSSFEKLVSASASAGTINGNQAQALLKGAASKAAAIKKYGK